MNKIGNRAYFYYCCSENYLLYDETKSMFSDLNNIATTIFHEYSHQWFGNRVTPKWFSYNWMKEGFATLFGSYATDWLFPEWRLLDTFVFSVVQNVMIFDATSETRPMTHYVESPKDLTNLFDSIAYSKCKYKLSVFSCVQY